MPGSSIDGMTSWSRPACTSASEVRLTTAWKVSRAVLPMICSSSSAEPTPGTCTRMRSAPWRWIDGSRVPASSTRRRMISRLCCMVRWSSAVFCASVSVITSWSPSARVSNSRRRRAGDREDRLRHLVGRLQRRLHAGGIADADAQLLRPGVEPPHAADLVAQVAQLVAQLGPEALELLGVNVGGLDLHQHVRAAAQVEPEVDQPRRQPRRPARHVALHLRRQRLAARHRLAGVVGALDPAVEGVRQRDQDADQADAQDQHALPERKVGHVCVGFLGAPAGARARSQASAGSVLLITWLMVALTTRTLTLGAAPRPRPRCRRPWSPCRSSRPR